MSPARPRRNVGEIEHVVWTESSICSIDSERGTLTYRGYEIADLVANCSFEEVVHLLWHGKLPDPRELRHTADALGGQRPLGVSTVELLQAMPHYAAPTSVLRTAVSALGVYDPRAESELEETNVELAYYLTAQIPIIVAAYHRVRRGLEPVTPDPGLSHAGVFLHCLTGQYPDDLSAHSMDNCLILHAEHGFNPSTFAARVTASTLSDMYSAVIAGIGALRGPLHGGANQRVIGMLQRIGKPENARDWVRGQLGRKRRVVGFGHHVYNTEDPRATVLREWSRRLGEHVGQPHWYEIGRAVEETMLAETGLHPNVDFYSASVYHMLGIEHDLYTCVFALARIVGWTAHILEQWRHGHFIRPRADYVGEVGLEVVPLDER